MIMPSNPFNNLSIYAAVNRTYSLCPIMSPQIPPATINISMVIGNFGIFPWITVLKRLNVWENKVMYKELEAAFFVSMEKK